MASNIGSMFNLGGDWQPYKERLDQFFVENCVDEDKKVSVLITVIGASAYATLTEICDPVIPNTLKYEKLCDILKTQFSISRERSAFYQLKQGPNESSNDWYARVKLAAENCNFGNDLIDALKVKLILDRRTNLGQFENRLCAEEPSKLLADLVDIDLKKDAVAIQSQSQTTTNHVSRTSEKKEIGKQNYSHDNSSLKLNKEKTERSAKSEAGKLNNEQEYEVSHSHNLTNCKYRMYKSLQNTETLLSKPDTAMELNNPSHPLVPDMPNETVSYDQYESDCNS